MAITKAQQARQLYKNGGSMEDIGFSIAKPSKNGSRPGYRRSNYDDSGGGFDGPNTGKSKGPDTKNDGNEVIERNKRDKARGKIAKEIQKPTSLRKKIRRNPIYQTLSFLKNPFMFGIDKIMDKRKGKKINELFNIPEDIDYLSSDMGFVNSLNKPKETVERERDNFINTMANNNPVYDEEFTPYEGGEIAKLIAERNKEEAYRFFANGGRAAFQEGGGIFPRIDKLGNKVSSAEEELANISQRLDTAQSSLGGQGGQNSGGGIMDNSILPDTPFPNVAEANGGGGIMNNSILPDTPFPNVAEPAEVSPFPGIEPVSNEGIDGQTDSSYNQNFNNIFTAPSQGGGEILGPNIGSNNPAGPTPPAMEEVPYNMGQPATPPQFSGPRPAVDLPGGMPSNPPVPLQTDLGQYTRPMPFELQGPGTGNAPPMTNLSNSQIDGTNSIPRPGTSIGDYLNSGVPISGGRPMPPGINFFQGPINQGSGMNLGGGQLLPPGLGGPGGQGVIGGGPRIPQPTITPGQNSGQISPLQTAISGGGLNGLAGYGKPANMMAQRIPETMDPRGLTQEQMMMMNRGGFAEGGMPGYEGGIMDIETGRQQYFLGKLVKKAKRAIGKITKSKAGKAALLGLGAYGFKKFGGFEGIGEGFGKGFNFLKEGYDNIDMDGKDKFSLLAAAGLTAAPLFFQDDEKDPDFTSNRGPGLNIEELRKNPYATMGGAYRFYADGGEVEPVAKETMPLLDMDNQEMDLRQEGGFVAWNGHRKRNAKIKGVK